MKRLITLAVAIMLICSMSVFALADGTGPVAQLALNPQIKGNRLYIDVVMNDNPGIAGAYLCFTYDQEYMNLVDVDNGTVFPKNEGYGFTPSESYETYPFVVLYDGVANSTKTGKICTLQFKFKENAAAANYNVGFDDKETFFAGLDSENKPVLVEIQLSSAEVAFDGYKDMSLPITLAITNGVVLIVAAVIIVLKRRKKNA